MSSKRRKKNNFLLLLGCFLCFLPTILNLLFQNQNQDLISSFYQEENQMNTIELQKTFIEAKRYNENLYLGIENTPYERMLDYSSTHVMATIQIPVIDINLPIYHGTKEDVLNVGIGHFEFSSLPVGGKNSHCILTGHRGLPNAKLFTRLDELKKKDRIYLRVCSKELVYEVEKSQVIEPEQILSMDIQKDKDLLSLVTCTPYGINTKRLVVHARRIYPLKKQKKVRWSMSLREFCFVLIPCLLCVCIIVKKVKK